ncbi:MAG: NAD(P)-dependent oxidoreductase [Thermodesulfobacteriota bacterium]
MTAVMVTGGMGVIGSLISRELVAQGTRTIVFGRHEDRTLIKRIADSIQIITGNILDLQHLLRIIQTNKVQRIIHAAACLSQQAQKEPFNGFQINVDGTVNVLEAARLTGIERVVFASSKAVYQRPTGKHAHPACEPITEDYPKEPDTVYGASKLFGEYMGLNYLKIYGLDFVALRFGSTYSYGKLTGRHGFAGIPAMIENAARGEPTRIPHRGDRKDDMVYSKDAARAAVLACFADNPRSRIYHIGTGKGTSLSDLAAVLKKCFPKAVIEFGQGPDASDRGRHFIFDIRRAQVELGYKPQYDLEAGVRDYIAEMTEAGG